MSEAKVVGFDAPTQPTTPVYDPAKKYTWKDENTFTLKGGEFGLILNTLRNILATEEAAKFLLAQQANKVLESQLADAVAAGTVVEAVE